MSEMNELLGIMARLRDPDEGCPWDREQTLASIVPHTIEEAYEVADAIARKDMEELRDELGDLLFQVVFYAQIAKEQGAFSFTDVVDAIVDKLTRRHPHVFDDAAIETAAAQSEAWERHKAAERAASSELPSALDGVAAALPAVMRAAKLQKRAARVGFDWEDVNGVMDKIGEELEEVGIEIATGNDRARVEHEIGDLLFACVNLARHVAVEPESALRHANARFERRFRHMEACLAAQNKDTAAIGLDELEALWQAAKRAGL